MKAIIGLFICLSFCASCSSDKEANGIEYFQKNKEQLNILSKFLLYKYSGDTNRKVISIINPELTKGKFDFQTIDTEVIHSIESLNIEQINLERENFCNGNNFDKVYFHLHDDSYHPITYIIYSACGEKKYDYTSETIRRITIKPHWDILIDNSR